MRTDCTAIIGIRSAEFSEGTLAFSNEPVSVQLRYLQTLTEIGVEKNTTVVFPVPVDFLSGLHKLLAKEGPPPAK